MAAGSPDSEEVDLTTLLNILMVMVSFLILSAVFSQVTIQELNMPTNSGGQAPPANTPPPVVIEVMLRKSGLEIGNGKTITDRIPLVGDSYDTTTLSNKLKLLKDRNMSKKDVILLMEPDIDYATMISVMDALKFIKVPAPREGSPALTVVLFPNVTVGDAP